MAIINFGEVGRGNTPTWLLVLTDLADEPHDLTDAAVTFYARDRESKAYLFKRECTIAVAAYGLALVTLTAGNTKTIGKYEADARIIKSDGTVINTKDTIYFEVVDKVTYDGV